MRREKKGDYMFDVSRLQDTSRLAKELVEKGIAKDFEEAVKMIESKNLVKSNDELQTINSNKTEEFKEEKSAESSNDSDSVSEEAQSKSESSVLDESVKKLEQRISQLQALLERYIAQNDKNLMELDSRLKVVEARLASIKSGSAPVQKQLSSSQSDSGKETEPSEAERKHVTGAGEGLNPDDFAVDKIFNNAHGRLEK